MLFNSIVFAVFAVVFFSVWWLVKWRPTARYLTIIGFSFFFYAYDTPWWLLLLMGTAILDYFAGLGILSRPHLKRLWVTLSLSGNLGLLLFFKYQFFIGKNLSHVLQLSGLNLDIPVRQLALPIGISFYTFQSMSYTIGAYRGILTPTRNILHFFAYVSLWPQLVAGPIEKAAHLLPQVANPKPLEDSDVWEAMLLIVRGFFKKMVIADNLAPAVNAAFGATSFVSSAPHWWLISIMFALQIYGDFSGYTDIARGFAKLMGLEFALNFNHPYGARSVQDFWRKWHISLSTWFRDYLYIPLGGNRGSTWQGVRNMWITMLVSGIWHGAAWTFLIWGALHATYLTVERFTDWPKKLATKPGGKHLAAVLVFGLVTIAWVFFRSNSTHQAFSIVATMLNPLRMSLAPLKAVDPSTYFFLLLAIAMVLNSYFGWLRNLYANNSTVRNLRPVFVALLIMVCIFWRGPGGAFIYFQF
ncbi:MBOAT family O-acyltransferase [Fimbriimonas ginsengisoli]|uniref:Membrane-bound O-acyltransferase n=1 Tax=Fimbriimonas ginsengisoli Gsoil 348 TaxID=661478 RepID=A0A068NV47_FIMGI|nr:MBOAT family O-acyltransferase [Fimbriimonas ginsengisoli]AIE86625.1 membrane-bound O-acyltransferase [Fimbriimonas ginsengisoli Gsoil 348]